MDPLDQDALKRLAGKYIWWKTPDEAVAMPARVVAQVMNIGDYDDVQALAHQVGDQYLRDVLVHAEIGLFNELLVGLLALPIGAGRAGTGSSTAYPQTGMTDYFKPRMNILPAGAGVFALGLIARYAGSNCSPLRVSIGTTS